MRGICFVVCLLVYGSFWLEASGHVQTGSWRSCACVGDGWRPQAILGGTEWHAQHLLDQSS